MIQLKTGQGAARFENPHWKLLWAMPRIQSVYDRYGLHPVITEGNDTQNRPYFSYHKTNPLRAMDLRTWTTRSSGIQIDWEAKRLLAEDISDQLGDGWDVVPKPTHIHIEYEGSATWYEWLLWKLLPTATASRRRSM